LIHLIPQEHTLFRGLGNDRFADVSREAGPVLSERTTARAAHVSRITTTMARWMRFW